MAAELVITIDNGHLRFVHDDALVDLLALGEARIARASHVEPTADAQWTADMAPSDGPVLGPFKLRSEALAAERAWLSEHRGL